MNRHFWFTYSTTYGKFQSIMMTEILYDYRFIIVFCIGYCKKKLSLIYSIRHTYTGSSTTIYTVYNYFVSLYVSVFLYVIFLF